MNCRWLRNCVLFILSIELLAAVGRCQSGDAPQSQGGKPTGYNSPTASMTASGCCVKPPHHVAITDVVVLIDSTSSMGWFAANQTRLSLAQWCALDVSDSVPDRLPAAFVKLEDSASTIRQLSPLVGDERSKLRVSVMQLRAVGGESGGKTNGTLSKLFEEAKHLLPPNERTIPLIVLVTDGMDCDPNGAGVPLRDLKSRFGEERLHLELFGICDSGDVSSKLSELAQQAGKHGHFSNIKSYHDLPSALSETRSLLNAVIKARDLEEKWCLDSLDCRIKENAKLEVKAAELHEKLKCCHEEKHKLECEVNKLEAGQKALHEKLKHCHERLSNAEVENTRLEIANKELDEKLKCCREEKRKLEIANEQLELDKKDLQERLRHCHEAKVKLEEAKLHLQTENAKLELDKKELKGSVTTLTGRVEQLLASKSFLTMALFGAVVAIVFLLLWLQRCISDGGSARADAARLDAEVKGAIREMAANKKDCCCPPPAPAVVYGPITTTPNGPVTTTTPNGPVTTDSSAPVVTTPSITPTTTPSTQATTPQTTTTTTTPQTTTPAGSSGPPAPAPSGGGGGGGGGNPPPMIVVVVF